MSEKAGDAALFLAGLCRSVLHTEMRRKPWPCTTEDIELAEHVLL